MLPHSSRRLPMRCRLGPQGTLRADPEQELEGTALLTTVRGSDPEYIKRLKREMHVALRRVLFAFRNVMPCPAMISRMPFALGCSCSYSGFLGFEGWRGSPALTMRYKMLLGGLQ